MKHDTEVVGLAAKAAPPLSVSGMTILGVSVPDWAIILTIVYTVLAIFVLIRDKFWDRRKGERSEP